MKLDGNPEADLLVHGKVLHMRSHLCKNRVEHGPYDFDRTLATVECRTCGALLNPMAVIESFARYEGRMHLRIFELRKEEQRLRDKIETQNRVKCEHCDKLTRIRK